MTDTAADRQKTSRDNNQPINRLRAKIEENPENPQMVLTVWGIGYKFSDEQ